MSVTLGRAVRAPRFMATIGLGVALLALQLVLRGEQDAARQIVGQIVAFAVFVAALALVWRGLGVGRAGLVAVVVLAACFRAAAFVPGDQTPPLSGDVHRYAWDGEVQLAGINPYRYGPLDPALASLRDDAIWPGINHPEWKTIYPPGAQASFAASQAVFGSSVRSTTWLFLIAELAAVTMLVVVLARLRAPPERVLAYAWHPLAISEIAGNGHVDALAIAGVAGLMLAWTGRRRVLAGLCVGWATLVKLGPLVLLPVLARAGGRRFALASAGLIACAYVPYAATVGTGVLGSLRQFEAEERLNASLDFVLTALWSRQAARIVLAIGFVALIAVVALREHDDVRQVARSCLLVLGGLIMVVDYVQPWHALILIPFFALVPAPGWIWLTGMLPVIYVLKVFRGEPTPLWTALVIYVPVGAAAVWRIWSARRPRAQVVRPLADGVRVAAVIPALNEAEAIGGLLAEWPAGGPEEIIVVDGASTDGTRDVAERGGARVVLERRRGYGRACATGAAATDAEVIVFLDGDGSCDPRDLARVVAPLLSGEAAFCLGARTHAEPGALTGLQRVGNAVVCTVVRLLYGVRVSDIPCMRAIRADTLASLDMREAGYGWPTEMIVKAARRGVPIAEVAVTFRRRRGGESKVAGQLGPSAKAGARMLAVCLRHT